MIFSIANSLAKRIEMKYPRSKCSIEPALNGGYYVRAYVYIGGHAQVFFLVSEDDIAKIEHKIEDTASDAKIKQIADLPKATRY
jgi:hypothetical protein